MWQAVTEALQQPKVLAEGYQRSMAKAASPHSLAAERKQLSVALKRLKAQEDRATDAYVGEAMGLDRYKVEMDKLRQQKSDLDRRHRELDQRQQQEQHSRSALDHIDRFCRQVTQGLDALTFEEREQLLKLLVEKVTVEDGRARIETVIPTGPENLRNPRGELVEPPALDNRLISSQSPRISACFFCRDQPLICRSRSSASIRVGNSSANSNVTGLRLTVYPSICPARCAPIRDSRLSVWPT